MFEFKIYYQKIQSSLTILKYYNIYTSTVYLTYHIIGGQTCLILKVHFFAKPLL